MSIEYTKEGMKIIHPTGVVQNLSEVDLSRLKNKEEERKTEIAGIITLINTHLTKIILKRGT